ncbi:transcription initiation factor TFIID subunit 13-like [Juglans regia]|uniref:Transcription initiation factor TFIID subunit 13 n=1 Tax=Juglans regia TaxID=51240 RepID=A0A6P9DST8_JUGRE|nr:transcription initiation factor TFIID subunit 13-like [Juglans regia]
MTINKWATEGGLTDGGHQLKVVSQLPKKDGTLGFKNKCKFLYVKMYQPLLESVALVEDIVLECITDLVHKAQDIKSKRGKLSVEDFPVLIRKDLPKLNRCTELLSMNEELKQARKVFESDEEKLRKMKITRSICVVVLFYLHLFILSGLVRW